MFKLRYTMRWIVEEAQHDSMPEIADSFADEAAVAEHHGPHDLSVLVSDLIQLGSARRHPLPPGHVTEVLQFLAEQHGLAQGEPSTWSKRRKARASLRKQANASPRRRRRSITAEWLKAWLEADIRPVSDW